MHSIKTRKRRRSHTGATAAAKHKKSSQHEHKHAHDHEPRHHEIRISPVVHTVDKEEIEHGVYVHDDESEHISHEQAHSRDPCSFEHRLSGRRDRYEVQEQQ